MASISKCKKTGGWKISWRDPDGCQRSKRFPASSKKKEAEKFKNKVEGRVLQGLKGRDKRRDPLPTEEAIAAFCDSKAVENRPTAYVYECTLTKFLKWWSRGLTRKRYMSDMAASVIEDWYQSLLREGLKQRTARQYAVRVKTMWSWCARRAEFRDRCALVEEIQLPRAHKMAPKTAPTWAEMDRCIQAAADGAAYRQQGGVIDASAIERASVIMRFTGLRISQVWNLEWEDFDLERRTLHVRPEFDRGRVGRRIPVSPHLLEYLKAVGPAEGRLFRDGRQPEAKWINRCWRAAGSRSEISGWHAFRRGFETGLAGLHVNFYVLRKLVGHSMGVDDAYLDATGLNLEDAVERIPAIGEAKLSVIEFPSGR